MLSKANRESRKDHISNKPNSQTYSIHNIKEDNMEQSITYQYSQVLQLEHAVSNFIESLNRIVKMSPNYKTYLSSINNQHLPVELLPAFNRYKLKLAAELTSLKELDKLPLLKELQDYQSNFDINSREPIFSKLTMEDIQKLKQVKSSSEISDTELNDNYIPEEPENMSEKKRWPPKLPEIKDPSIRARVFIHKSMINDKLYLSESDMIKTHNERLEFLGDSILNTTITTILYNKFPSFNEGQLSQLRMKLISNEKLKQWSYLYEFPSKLKTNVDTDLSNNDFLSGKQKLYADVFEAYIGGLIEEDPKHNLPKVRKWLTKLSEPVINEETKTDITLESTSEVDVNAKKTLYSLIGYAALGLHYKPIQKPNINDPNAIVECRIKDGTVLGSGKGKNTKIAGMRAAQNVLQNKQLVELYSAKRASIPREQSAVRIVDLPGNKKRKNTKDHTYSTTISKKGKISLP